MKIMKGSFDHLKIFIQPRTYLCQGLRGSTKEVYQDTWQSTQEIPGNCREPVKHGEGDVLSHDMSLPCHDHVMRGPSSAQRRFACESRTSSLANCAAFSGEPAATAKAGHLTTPSPSFKSRFRKSRISQILTICQDAVDTVRTPRMTNN